jgi:NTP pyrophosphatase (non-canonical NTP hydrolase)
VNETQEAITAWAVETFGGAGCDLRIAVRVGEEMSELLRALTTEQFDKVPAELADVAITMCRLATRLGVALSFEPIGSRECVDVIKVATAANIDLSCLIYDLTLEGDPEFRYRVTSRVVEAMSVIATTLGVSLQAEINRKMQINRERVWRVDGSGCGYHRKDAS